MSAMNLFYDHCGAEIFGYFFSPYRYFVFLVEYVEQVCNLGPYMITALCLNSVYGTGLPSWDSIAMFAA